MIQKIIFIIALCIPLITRAMDAPPLAKAAAGTVSQPLCEQILTGHTAAINCVAISADGNRALTGSDDNTALLWDLSKKPATSQVLSGHKLKVTTVTFTNDLKYALTGSDDKTVFLWDITVSPAVCKEVLRHIGQITNIAVTKKSDFILVGAYTEPRLWNLTQSPATMQAINPGLGKQPILADISPNGQFAVTGGIALVKLWDLLSKPPKVKGGLLMSKAHFLAFSSDGTKILVVTTTYAIWWDIFANKKTFLRHKPSQPAALSGDGSHVLLTDKNQGYLYDVKKPVPSVTLLGGHTGLILAVACSSGCYSLTGSNDMTARLWDRTKSPPGCEILAGHTGAVTSVAISPLENYVILGSADGTASLWKIA